MSTTRSPLPPPGSSSSRGGGICTRLVVSLALEGLDILVVISLLFHCCCEKKKRDDKALYYMPPPPPGPKFRISFVPFGVLSRQWLLFDF